MDLGLVQRRKECDSERVGYGSGVMYAEAMGHEEVFFLTFVFHLSAMKVFTEGKGECL